MPNYRSKFYDWAAREAGIDSKVANKAKPYVMAASDYKARGMKRFLESIFSHKGAGSTRKVTRSQSKRKSMPKRKAVHHVARSGSKKSVVKRSKKGSRSKKSLKARVSKLEKYGPKNACHDFRRLDSNYVANASNSAAYRVMSAYNASIREAAIDSLKYIDRGATPASDNISLVDPTYKTDIHFANFYSKFCVRNNNSIPAVVDIYCFRAKDDTSLTPVDCMTATDATYGITNADINVLTYPSDFDLVKRQWSMVKHARLTLQAGDETFMVHTFKNDLYNPEMKDTLSTTYIKGDIIWVCRCQGIIAHDATTEENIGYADAQVDLVNYMKFLVKYPSDSVVHNIETSVNLDSLTVPEAAGPSVDAAVNDDHN